MFFVKSRETNPESLLQFLDITFWKDMWQLYEEIKRGNNSEAKLLLSGFGGHLGKTIAILKARDLVKTSYELKAFRYKLTQDGYERKRELFPGM